MGGGVGVGTNARVVDVAHDIAEDISPLIVEFAAVVQFLVVATILFVAEVVVVVVLIVTQRPIDRWQLGAVLLLLLVWVPV